MPRRAYALLAMTGERDGDALAARHQSADWLLAMTGEGKRLDRRGRESRVFYVYILASHTNVTLYTGVTNDLARRVYEHKNALDPNSFTARYHIHKLVYYEACSEARSAIAREKQIKSWNRKRKNALVETVNPQWRDLYSDLL